MINECVVCLESEGEVFHLGCKCVNQYWHIGCFIEWNRNHCISNGWYNTKCMICKHQYNNVDFVFTNNNIKKQKYTYLYCILSLCFVITIYVCLFMYLYHIVLTIILLASIFVLIIYIHEDKRMVYPQNLIDIVIRNKE